MENKKKIREKLIFQLVISIFSLVLFSYVILTFFLIAIIHFEHYEIDAPKANFPPFLSVSTIIFVSLIIGFMFSIYISKKFLRPINILQGAMNEVKNGNFNIKIDNIYHNETKDLIDNFNLMVGELRKSETLKTDFISNVSHEFKTPLSSIQGYATLLQDETLSKEDRDKYTKYIIDSTKKLNVLVGNILKISKIDNQKIVIEPTLFSLDEQIRECILNLEKEWSSKNIDLDIDLEEMKIKTDKVLLENVWNNVIGNAIKYSNENGKVDIKGYQENNQIIIKIRDYGEGIKEENLPYIFNKFYQGDSSRASEGNGLGLSLVKGILDLIGGEIRVTSKVNEGSEFTIVLNGNKIN